MIVSTATPVTVDAIDRAHAAVGVLRDLPLELASDDEIVTVWRELETLSRRVASIEHAVIAQANTRHLDRIHGARNMATFARGLLGIDIGDARTRVAVAAACGPRQALTGEGLPPVLPTLATALAEGRVSNGHGRIIAEMLDRLPVEVQVTRGAEIEGMFTEHAATLDPTSVHKLALHQLELAGVETPEPEYRERTRDFRMHVRKDGSCSFGGEGTAEFAEYVQVAFDTLARPRHASPADDSHAAEQKDPRTPGQRRHDAVIELVKLAMRAEQLPDSGGVTATLIVTVDAMDWVYGTGTVTTGHGSRVSTKYAKSWVSGDARVIAVALDELRSVAAYSDSHRIFTENQRLAMIARDGGCVFPMCDAPAYRCESHHVVEFADGGPTSVANGGLLCSFDHRNFERMGWRCEMIEGIPHFVPPKWIDPAQKPLRNWLHYPELGGRPPRSRGSTA